MNNTVPPDNDFIEICIRSLEATLPPVFARKQVKSLLGGAIASGTLANLQSQGLGPQCVRSGRNTIYEKKSFLQWLKTYLQGGIAAVKAAYPQHK